MVTYDVELRVQGWYKGEQRETTISADLRVRDDSAYKDTVEFMNKVKKIWTRAMKEHKRDNYVELTVCMAKYNNYSDDGAGLTQTGFRMWKSYEVDETGIYMCDDSRYSRGDRDVYLTKNVVNELASVLYF